MSESEIFVCSHCGKEHEASTQEVGAYLCPNLRKLQENGKVLDQVSLKYLTGINNSSETQEPVGNLNGDQNNGKEEAD